MTSKKHYNSLDGVDGVMVDNSVGEHTYCAIFSETIKILPKKLGDANAEELTQAALNISKRYKKLSFEKLYNGIREVERRLLSKSVKEIKKARVAFEPQYLREIQIIHSLDNDLEKENYNENYHRAREDKAVLY